MAPKMKLVYFNIRGRGEILRQVMVVGGMEFEDERIEFKDWPALKPKTPSGQLPYMEIEGKPFTQSMALARFLAKRCKLMGKNEMDELSVNVVASQLGDMRNSLVRIRFDSIDTEDQKKQLKEKYETETLIKFLDGHEKTLNENKNGFLVGDGVTLADLLLQDLLDTQLKHTPDVLTKYPKVTAHRKKITTLPKLIDYLAKRLDTDL